MKSLLGFQGKITRGNTNKRNKSQTETKGSRLSRGNESRRQRSTPSFSRTLSLNFFPSRLHVLRELGTAGSNGLVAGFGARRVLCARAHVCVCVSPICEPGCCVDPCVSGRRRRRGDRSKESKREKETEKTTSRLASFSSSLSFEKKPFARRFFFPLARRMKLKDGEREGDSIFRAHHASVTPQ